MLTTGAVAGVVVEGVVVWQIVLPMRRIIAMYFTDIIY
jgi:hypothetical protein